MTKPQDGVASYLELAQRATAPIGRLNQVAARNVERAARLQYDLAGDWMQFLLAQMQATAEARDIGSLLSRQAEVTQQFIEKVSSRQQDLARLSAEAQADAARWFDEVSAG